MDINSINIIGRLTRDPELTCTQSGTELCKFSIANDQGYKKDGAKKEVVFFFNCTAWAGTAKVIAEYCTKGQRIAIQGKLQQNRWEDKEGNARSTVDISVQNFQFLEKPRGAEQGDPIPAGSSNTYDDANPNPFSDDDIPF